MEDCPFSESQLDGVCYQEKNYESAWTICASNGAGLCTKKELESNCSADAGGEFDSELIWLSTTGTLMENNTMEHLIRSTSVPSRNHMGAYLVVPTGPHSFVPSEVHSMHPC